MSTHQSTQNPSANPSTLSAVLTTQAPDITVMANTINALVQSNVPSRVKLRDLLRAVPVLTGPGVRVGRVRSSDGRGFSERVAAPTRLSCPGFSRG